MKTHSKLPQKLSSLIPALALLVGVNLTPLLAQAAGSGSIYLTASTTTLTTGQSVIIAVYMTGGGNAVNAVEADLSYSTAKLQYVGVNYNGSAFEITASGSGGGGAVSVARGTTGSVPGGGLVATLTFKSLSSTGSTTISVGGSSALASDGNSVPFVPKGIGLNFSAYSAPAASGSKSSSAADATPAPPKDSTPPVISDIKLEGVTPYSATVTWTTNEPSNSAVDYGLDNTYGLSVSSGTMTTKHSVALGSAFLAPQMLLHYHAKSADAAGNVATSTDQRLQLPGVAVTIVVRGANGKPQAGASVTIGAVSGTTDSKGSVTLPSALGNQKITTTYQGVTVQKSVTVAKTTKALPPYQLDLARQPLNRWMMASVSLLAVVLVLLGIDAVLFGSHFFSRLSGLHRLHLRSAVPAASVPTVSHFTDPIPVPSAVTQATTEAPVIDRVADPIEVEAETVSAPSVAPVAAADSAPVTAPTEPVAASTKIAVQLATDSDEAPVDATARIKVHKKSTRSSAHPAHKPKK